MNSFFLDNQDYTIKNALFWGNWAGHLKKACETDHTSHRVVHITIYLIEFLPVISQIASICELIFAKLLTEEPKFKVKKNIIPQVPKLPSRLHCHDAEAKFNISLVKYKMVEFQNPDTATFLDENKYVCDLDRAAIDCANSDKKKLLGEELQNHKALSTIELINNIHLVECYNKRIKLIDIIFLRFSFNDRIKHIKNFINNLCSRQHSFKSNKFDDKTLFFQFSKTDKIYSDLIKNLKISFEKSIDPVQDMLDDLQNSGSIYYYCIEGIDCFIYL